MSFWKELKRRNVFKVGIAYPVVAWLIIHPVDIIFPILHLPEWSITLVTVLLIIGFPFILILAWAFEITPEGLKRTKRLALLKSPTPLISKELGEPISVAVEKKVSAPVTIDLEGAPKTIAILPFVDISPNSDQGYFVDGLSEELLNTLTKIHDLRVTSRTSSFSFKNSNKTIQEIANILSVENILEGSVRKAGNSLRITAQLVRAKDDFHQWSETYDRELRDIFRVQEDIAIAVANELKITLGITKSIRPIGGTDMVAAYELYLVAQGQFNDNKWTNALETINAALAIDPRFSLALALKATFHNFLTIIVPTKNVASEQSAGMNAALRSIELEPNLAAGHYSLGTAKTTKANWIDAELSYVKAIELKADPSLTNETIFSHYLSVGQFEKANEILESANRKDPLNQWIRAHYIISLGLLDNIQKAKDEHKRGTALFGDRWLGNYCITQVRLGAGDSLVKDDILPYLSIDDVAKEHFESPEVGLVALRRLYADNESLSAGDWIILSMWIAYFGDHEFAFEVVKRALRIEASGTFFIWFPQMREVRYLARFKEFVKEIGLVDYWNKFGWPDLCHKLNNGDFMFD